MTAEYYNNSVNENSLNAKKLKSTKYQLKQLVKPLLALINNKKHKKNSYKKNSQPEYFNDCCCSEEIEDNFANEMLEAQILEEIDCCQDYSGVPVYRNGHMDIIPVFRGQNYIPVHFAKTEAGTFFWTTMIGAADSDIDFHGDHNAISEKQQPQVQACDRWAQA